MTVMRRRWMLRAGAVLVLGLVFLAYLRPDFAVTIANQIWACF